MKSDPTHRASLPAAVGMPCALISLLSGSVSLVVAFLLWWGTFSPRMTRIGEHVGLYSAIVGLALAAIGFAAPQKRVRRVAIAAIVVNLAILSLTIDNILMLFR